MRFTSSGARDLRRNEVVASLSDLMNECYHQTFIYTAASINKITITEYIAAISLIMSSTTQRCTVACTCITWRIPASLQQIEIVDFRRTGTSVFINKTAKDDAGADGIALGDIQPIQQRKFRAETL